MMKNITLTLITLISFSVFSQSFFDVNSIQKIEITFAQSNWDAILDTYYASGLKTRLIGNVTINGVQYDSVGVRYKGNSSYNAANTKNPFNIKLDYIKGKQNIDSRNVIKLSNVFRDPSFVREVVSYEIARKYMPAPESNYAEVYVNNTLIGLYVNDESSNLSFMGRHFFKPNYPYFEGVFDQTPPQAPCPISPPVVLGYMGADTNCYKRNYTIQSNNPLDWNDLKLALDTFNNYPNYMDNGIYIDGLLWMLAFDNVMVNLDAPINSPQNFTMYKDKTQRFNMLLWDLNESFGSFNNDAGVGGATLTNTELQQLSPWFHANSIQYPILKKTFENVRFKKMYIAKMKTIFNENIKNDLYKTRISEIQSVISSSVGNDPNKFYTTAQFTQNKTATVSGRIGLTELMDARKSYLNSQADFQKTQPTISNIVNSPTEVHSNDVVTISANITDANYAYLAYRFSPKEKFKKVDMSMSGTTFTANITAQYADIQYYIWAENDDAGMFSPERAEFEFHKIGVTGDVVINELQSSNKSTKFDEAVEYDDWVELYNNTDAAIDLTGYYLSDNKDTLTKWQIPSQSIPANGYVIFWTDKDIAQGVNHTNFQLTKNGESFYLVNPSGNIVDQVTYRFMNTDMSYSRYENGRGAFRIQEPTFKASNGGNTSIGVAEIESANLKIDLFPNPSNDKLFLRSKDKKVSNMNIQIVDIAGKELVSSKWTNHEETQIMDVSKLNAGIYIIRIGDFTVLKFIKK